MINVLLEETLQVLFTTFPDTFVFFGGASLVLFYGSSRHSGDLDLLIDSAAPPTSEQLRTALRQPLREIASILRLPTLTIDEVTVNGDLIKLAVKADDEHLFTIDLTNISTVIRSEIIEFAVPVDSAPSARVRVPSRDFHLLLKLEAFLTRRYVKARDAFDIKLLIDSGATLHDNLKTPLTDGPAAEKIENPEFIAKRIEQINQRTCIPELKPYLPEDVFRELAGNNFETLRQTLRTVFADWL